MKTLPADVQRKIALDLPPKDLIHLCATDKEMRNDICISNEFWRLKLERDYPTFFKYFQEKNIPLANPKNTYIRKFGEIAQTIENFVSKHFPESEHKKMFDKIYSLYYEVSNTNATDEILKIRFPEFINNDEFMTGIRRLIEYLLRKDYICYHRFINPLSDPTKKY